MKSSNIGGQAVLEGIMMKNGKDYAVAVRKPDKEIEVKKDEYRSFIKWEKLTKIPFIRGIFNFIDSMVLGMKTLTYSASFYEEEETSRVLTEEEAKKQEKKENVLMGITVAVSIVLAMGIFMVLPYFISGLFDKVISSRFIKSVIEGLIRIAIFIGYILLISRMKDIQRVFMYHGAEHKCINCIEHGLELNVENVKKFEAAQTLWNKLSVFCVVCQHHCMFFYYRRISGAKSCAPYCADSTDCRNFL